MAQPDRRVIGEAVAKVAADLLGTPSLRQQLSDHAAELIVGLDLSAVLTRSSRGGATMSVEGAILAADWRVAP